MSSVITLNQGQQEAADAFFAFLLSEEREMIISGPPGVGKTALMGHLIDRVMPMYHDTCRLMGISVDYDEVVMAATTNKAAEVLSEATGRPASTIQSFMNLIVRDDYSTGRSTLKRTDNWVVHQRKIIFVEECSTIDSTLDQMIREGTHDCKIVYVGDRNQIGPIMEDSSPIYRRNLRMVELTQPVRNAGQPALMALCDQLRRTVETGEFLPIKMVPGVIEWLDDQSMEAAIENMFKTQTDTARILAFTNQRVTAYNDHIRGVRALPLEYQVGERLVSNSAIRVKNQQVSVEERVWITHLDDQVDSIAFPDGAILDVRHGDIQTRFKGTLRDVPIPVDREHFTNLIRYFGRVKNWPAYYRLKNGFPDLRPSDASTFHKAQGSTYDTVFIDATNLSTCHQPDTVARMLYVAASRPRNRVYFYGNLAPKYGGLILP
jgi:hypothetical protein